MQRPMTKTSVKALCRLVELLKVCVCVCLHANVCVSALNNFGLCNFKGLVLQIRVGFSPGLCLRKCLNPQV